jgi:hypothetical protein
VQISKFAGSQDQLPAATPVSVATILSICLRYQ